MTEPTTHRELVKRAGEALDYAAMAEDAEARRFLAVAQVFLQGAMEKVDRELYGPVAFPPEALEAE